MSGITHNFRTLQPVLTYCIWLTCIMSAEDGPEKVYSDNYYNDSPSPSEQQCLSPNDMFENDVKEGRNGKKNRQSYNKTQSIPSVAVSEKIVICIDTSKDMSVGYTCTLSNQNIIDASAIMNEALRVFITNKLAIAKDTSFALVSIKPGDVELISTFTSDVTSLVKSLSEMKGGTNEEVTPDYDLTGMSAMFSSIDKPENVKSKTIPPEYIVRVILVYNNSYSIPSFKEVDKFRASYLNSSCIFDVVHLHEAQSDFNRVEKIYEQFSKVISPTSYFLECSRNVTSVFNIFAKLLAHPYQRVNQALWEF